MPFSKLLSNLLSTLLKMGESNTILKIAQQPAQRTIKNGREKRNMKIAKHTVKNKRESTPFSKLPSNLPSTLFQNNMILKIAQQPAQLNVKSQSLRVWLQCTRTLIQKQRDKPVDSMFIEHIYTVEERASALSTS